MRYVSARTRPRSGWDDEHPMLEAKTVHEPEPIDTGLLDADGNRIYRVMSPVGFVALKERS